ncbi:unnamed protein product [Cunninghamella echinulata]
MNDGISILVAVFLILIALNGCLTTTKPTTTTKKNPYKKNSSSNSTNGMFINVL